MSADPRIGYQLIASIEDDARTLREHQAALEVSRQGVLALLKRWYDRMGISGPVPQELIDDTKKELGL